MGLGFGIGLPDYRNNNGSVDLLTGLSAFWRFDNSLVDSSGNGKNLTAVGAPDYVAGKIGQSLRSPTANDYAERNELIVSSGPLSMGGWFYIDSETGLRRLLVQGGVGGATHGQFITYNAPTLDFYVGSGGSITALMTGLTGWQHIVCTHDGVNSRIYLNGVLVAGPTARTASFAFNNLVTRVLAFTINPGGAGGNFRADLCFFYNFALSGAQVARLYNGGSAFDPTA